jgi:hypothetical protein
VVSDDLFCLFIVPLTFTGWVGMIWDRVVEGWWEVFVECVEGWREVFVECGIGK